MEEELLIKYFNDTCTPQQEQEILQWVSETPQNRETFVKMKNLYVSQTMPVHSASDKEYQKFIAIAKKQKPKKYQINRYIGYAAVAVIVVLLALNLQFNFISGNKDMYPDINLADKYNKESLNILYAARGVKGEVVLPDGSKVWLNSDSKITYPAKFSGDMRQVEFSGEGYFDVVKDSLCPMVVKCSKNFRVFVYGTRFNIKSYENDDIAQATLYSGSIKLVENIGTDEIVTEMKPNESVIIKKNTTPVNLNILEPEKLSAWKEGDLIFESTPLKEVAKILERWHGVTVTISNKKIENFPITARFRTESIFQIMDLLNFSMSLNYEINGNNVIIK